MMKMMTSIPNCILHFLQLVHAAFFSQYSFPCSITPPRTAAGLWAGEPRVTGWSQRLGKGQPRPQTCLCPFPVSRLTILLHRWILFPPLPSELALYQSHLAHLLLPTFLHPALAWLVSHGFCCHLWGSLSTISTLLVSPLLWQLLIHPCSAAGTISLFPRWGVSVSPGHNPCSLLLFTFSPVLHLLSLPHSQVCALSTKVRLATFLSDPFPFSFPSGAPSLFFWLHNHCNYLSDDFLNFPSARNRHLWALFLINVF